MPSDDPGHSSETTFAVEPGLARVPRAARDVARALLSVVATYVSFLLFAQFGLLQQMAEILGEGAGLDAAMAAMGLCGLAASLGTGLLLARVPAPRLVRWSLLVTAGAALASRAATTPVAFLAVAAATGLGLGALAVAVASSLARAAAPARVGAVAGAGTGLAYLLSNVPVLFAGPPALRAVVPAALCLLAAAVPPRLQAAGARGPESPGDRGLALGLVVGSFALLIGLDSAVFTTVQRLPRLAEATWGGGLHSWRMGLTHLAAAVLAGLLLDRGKFRAVLVATFTLFAITFALLSGSAPGVIAGLLYATGISAYSAALVAYPSLGGERPGALPVRWRAALAYGLAGWIASGLGVAMAARLEWVPTTFAAICTAVVVLALLFATRRALPRLARLYGGALVFAALVVVPSLRPPTIGSRGGSALPATAVSLVDLGRRVYIAEGCIHCHSQYVRPDTVDTEWWGPQRPTAGGDSPRLLGNRRQGPDLANAGNRRSAYWHQRHLETPRVLSPSSRMPSYAHLFAPGRPEGPALVAYLSSLGAETAAERYRETQRAVVTAGDRGADAAQGAALFTTWCAACHGSSGRGDGPLALPIHLPSMDLTKGSFWLVSYGPEIGSERDGLARLVRYGLPGTSMPGHEYLTAEQLADLVAYVDGLAGQRVAATEAAPATLIGPG